MAGVGLHRDGKLPKILYIEDNTENRLLVRTVLEVEGYTVIEAEDGLAGIEAAVREEPALILLDINLPGVDGYEVVSILKSFPKLARTSVIAVTAYAMKGDRQRTLVAGCDGYIQKPIDVDAFPRQVAEFLQGKRERVEEREEGVYLRELNQRLVYRLVNQIEELERLNRHFSRRAAQLEDLHRAFQRVTPEPGVAPLLERLLPDLARALGTTCLTVELSDPAGVRVSVRGEDAVRAGSALVPSDAEPADDWTEVEWTLPLAVQDRSLGVLAARHVLPPGAKADEENLLKIVANQVATAVENARLHEERARQLRQTQTLLAVSQAVGSTLDLAEILRRTTREIVRALGADVGGAWVIAPSRDQFVPVAGYRVPKELALPFTRVPLSVGEEFIEELRRREGPIALSDSQGDARFDHPVVRLLPHKSLLIVPMLVKGELIGGVAVAWVREAHHFTPEELLLTEGMARQAAVAIENGQLLEAERKARKRQAAFVEIARDLAAESGFDRLFPLISEWVCQLLGVDSTVISLVEGDEIVYRGSYGLDRAHLAQRRKLAQSRVGRVVLSKRSYVSSDMTTDPHWRDSPVVTQLGYRAVLEVPVMLRGEVIGVLGALHRSLRTFSEDEVLLLTSMASHAAVALDRANLWAKMGARLRETQTLLTVSQAASSTLDLTEMMRRVSRMTALGLGADMVGTYLADGDQEVLRPIAGYHVPADLLEASRTFVMPLKGHRFLEEAWENQRPVFSTDAESDPKIDRETLERFPHRSVLFVPMVVKDRPIGGIFAVWLHQRRLFTSDDLNLVEGISRQAAIAIDNARLYADVTRQMAELKQAQAQLSDKTERLSQLADLAQSVTAFLDPHRVFEAVVDGSLELLRTAASSLWVVDPSTEELVLVAAASDPERPVNFEGSATRFPKGQGLTGWVVEHGRSRYSPILAKDPLQQRTEWVEREGLVSQFVVPLLRSGRALGALVTITKEKREFSPEEWELLETFAAHAAIAIDNARLYADVTRQMAELRQAQAQLVRSTKLAAIGELVAKIAHELNNPLTSVLGFSSFLAERVSPDDPMREELGLIQTEATRARDIVRDLLDFTRQREFHPEPTDVNVVLEQTVALVRRQGALDEVALQELYAADLPLVEVDVSRIKQVFLNIINNAIHAMPNGGSLTVATKASDADVQVEFTDTGTGIAPEHLPRIFEPFFTTKPDVSGTGLGLSVSLGIVQSHGGTIEVESEVGTGSTFTVRLPSKAGAHPAAEHNLGEPRAQGSAERPGGSMAETPAPAPPSPTTRPAGPRVLVVDDHQPVRELVRAFLDSAGFEIVSVPNAAEALRTLREPVDLVISDLYMPGMDGLSLYREVVARQPSLQRRFLLMTGGLVTEAVQEFLGEDKGMLLRKPFSRQQLLDAVREILGGSNGSR